MIVLAGQREGEGDHIYGFKPTLLTLLAAPQLTGSLTAAATDLTVGHIL